MEIYNHIVNEIYYINGEEIFCSFKREYDANAEVFADLVVFYNDSNGEWIFNDCQYNNNGDVVGLVPCTRLNQDEIREIKNFIVDYFNRNYDIELFED